MKMNNAWFKNIFRCMKNNKKQDISKPKNTMFSDIDTLEKFVKILSMYYKQEIALDYDQTYFEPQDSLFGEMLDNSIRIKLLREEHSDFDSQINHDELKEKMKEEFFKDCKEQGIELNLENDEIEE